MHKHPFLILLGLNIVDTLAAPPASWLAPVCTVLLAPVAVGVLAARFFARQPIVGRVLRLLIVVGAGALLRPYWWAAMTDHDFTFDHEPEVEFEVAFIQFVIAGVAFFVGSLPRRSPAA